jgi:hypothetical protein
VIVKEGKRTRTGKCSQDRVRSRVKELEDVICRLRMETSS